MAQVGSKLTCPDCGAKTEVKVVATKAGLPPPITVPIDGYELSEPLPARTLELIGYGQPLTTLHGRPSATISPGENARNERRARKKLHRPPKFWMMKGLLLYSVSRSVFGTLLVVASVCPLAYYILWLIDLVSSMQGIAVAAVFLVVMEATMIGFALTYLATLLLAIVEVSSDGQDGLADEFDLMFIDRVVRLLFLTAAWMFALFPGELVNLWMGSPAAWQLIPGTPLNIPALVGFFVLLPVTQLSVLEAGSMVVPVSYNILRSMWRNAGAWGAFYSVSVVIVTATAGLIVAVAEILPTPLAIWISGLLLGMGLVTYYRLLGRLAWYCAENTRPAEAKSSTGPYEPLYP